MRFRPIAFAVALFTLQAVAPGQPFAPGQFRSANYCNPASCEITFTVAAGEPVAISGAPYSGTQSSESVQTLADGTQLKRPTLMAATIYRDSQGRLRTEQPAFPFLRQMAVNPNVKPFPDFTIVEIQDPVAGYQYLLDSTNKVAHALRSRLVPEPFNPSPPLLPPPPRGPCPME